MPGRATQRRRGHGRSGQPRERIDSGERVEERPRWDDRVQALEHDRALHGAAQLGLPRELERHCPEHPHHAKPDQGTGRHAAHGVQEL
jgi:hypothetical protein